MSVTMPRAVDGESRYTEFLSALAIAVLSLLVPALVSILLAIIYRHGVRNVLLSVLPLIACAMVMDKAISASMERDRSYILKHFMLAGRGLKLKALKAKAVALVSLVDLSAVLGVFVLLHVSTRGLDPILMMLLLVLILAILIVYFSPRIAMSMYISGRRTSIEVEAPYFMALTRVLSSITMPFYDILSIVENSVSLRAFSKEIKLAKKIATMRSLSILTALDTLCSNHPSEVMREYVRRIAIAASSMGDIRSASEGSFEAIYTVFESKVSRLVERFTIIVGSALFAYLFMPVIVAAIAPVIGGDVLQTVIMTLSFQILVFFLLYAISTSYYPSSLAVRYTRGLAIGTALSIGLATAISTYNMVSRILGAVFLDDLKLYIALVLTLVPGLIVSEKAYRRVVLYDKFTRIASDAASLATATGENYLLVLERTAARYGRGMTRFVRRISTSYTSEPLRGAVIASAPSIFHSSFTETLTYTLLYGASPAMLKSFASSYEKIVTLVSRVRGMALSIEAMMMGLAAMIGGFLAYLNKVFQDIARIAGEAGAPGLGLARFFAYNPAVYSILDALTILSLILISVFIGKIRGGTIAFSFRSAIIALTLYFAAKTVVGLIT